ncbi:MAG: TldE/PmbA family protein, partial [Candidatus Eisenbacteria bacterium]|nr:TldE/PmbA family protein [Candidatus Eisenbacteria bacterium]
MRTDTVPPAGASGVDAEMQSYFLGLADFLQTRLQGSEIFLASFYAEDSDFARFNRALVRQAGHVTQRNLNVDLILGEKSTAGSVTLSGVAEADRARLDSLVSELRERLPHLPDDPHLLYAKEVRSTEAHGTSRLPDAPATLAAVLEAARGLEFVGLWASGGMYSGFANSLGQRNWFSSYTFNLDWSVYHSADKAVKSSYAGFEWSPEVFARKLEQCREQLGILGRESKTISPGRYRVYLAPVALGEIVGMLGWGGLGLKSLKTKQTVLLKMAEEGVKLHPGVTLRENTREGLTENFQGLGFIKP